MEDVARGVVALLLGYSIGYWVGAVAIPYLVRKR